MSIDRQRIEAVKVLERMGWCYVNGTWAGPAQQDLQAPADLLHHLLVVRADALAGAPDGSDEARELDAIVCAIEEYEATRWPDARGSRN